MPDPADRKVELEHSVPGILDEVPAPMAFASGSGDFVFPNRALRQLEESFDKNNTGTENLLSKWLATEDHPTMLEINTRFYQVRKVHLGSPLGGALHIGTDVTQLMTSKALYQVLSAVYRLITQGSDRATLFSGTVEALWNEVPIEMVWVGEVDTMTGEIKPIATRSRNELLSRYVAERRIRLDDPRDEVGPILRAVRLNRSDVVQDTMGDLGLAPFRERYQAMETRSIAVCPIRRQDRVTHILVTYGRRAKFFSEEVVELLERVADGLSFGLISYERSQALETLALTDAVTGLPNRVSFLDQLEQVIQKRQGTSNTMTAVAYMDLDGFKAINDTHGHAAGDEVLRIVAARVTAAIGPNHVMGRLGGDEFCLLIQGTSQEHVAEVLRSGLHAMEVAMTLNRQTIHLSASIGVALFPQDGDSPDLLLRMADMAMYQAKAAGKGRFRMFRDLLSNQPGMRLP